MNFVHPQIKFNLTVIWRLIFSRVNKKSVINQLAGYFPNKHLYLTDSGRSAFQIIIEKLNLQNSELIMPAYICQIFQPILEKYNIKPIFVDIEPDSFNVSPEIIAKKITPNTKAILICHTYGLPVNLEPIKQIANQYNLKLIEDCAHAIEVKYQNKYVGNFGDASFFSFSKCLPSTAGGLVVTSEKWDIKLLKNKFSFNKFLSLLNLSRFWAFLLRTLKNELLNKTYNLESGDKFTLEQPITKPQQIDKLSLRLIHLGLENYSAKFTQRREQALKQQQQLIAQGYQGQNSNNNGFTYLSVLLRSNLDRDELIIQQKQNNNWLGTMWYDPIILQPEVIKKYQLNLADYPVTCDVAKRIVNWPINI